LKVHLLHFESPFSVDERGVAEAVADHFSFRPFHCPWVVLLIVPFVVALVVAAVVTLVVAAPVAVGAVSMVVAAESLQVENLDPWSWLRNRHRRVLD
jgi:hypothetical protein